MLVPKFNHLNEPRVRFSLTIQPHQEPGGNITGYDLVPVHQRQNRGRQFHPVCAGLSEPTLIRLTVGRAHLSGYTTCMYLSWFERHIDPEYRDGPLVQVLGGQLALRP